MINNLKFILLFIPFMVNSQAREVAKISPLGKLTARLDVGMDSKYYICLLYTSPSPRDRQKSRMPSSA